MGRALRFPCFFPGIDHVPQSFIPRTPLHPPPGTPGVRVFLLTRGHVFWGPGLLPAPSVLSPTTPLLLSFCNVMRRFSIVFPKLFVFGATPVGTLLRVFRGRGGTRSPTILPSHFMSVPLNWLPLSGVFWPPFTFYRGVTPSPTSRALQFPPFHKNERKTFFEPGESFFLRGLRDSFPFPEYFQAANFPCPPLLRSPPFFFLSRTKSPFSYRVVAFVRPGVFPPFFFFDFLKPWRLVLLSTFPNVFPLPPNVPTQTIASDFFGKSPLNSQSLFFLFFPEAFYMRLLSAARYRFLPPFSFSIGLTNSGD